MTDNYETRRRYTQQAMSKVKALQQQEETRHRIEYVDALYYNEVAYQTRNRLDRLRAILTDTTLQIASHKADRPPHSKHKYMITSQ